MKVVERINAIKLPAQSISSFNNFINSDNNAVQPKLSMVWQTEWRNGRECLVANWVAE